MRRVVGIGDSVVVEWVSLALIGRLAGRRSGALFLRGRRLRC